MQRDLLLIFIKFQ